MEQDLAELDMRYLGFVSWDRSAPVAWPEVLSSWSVVTSPMLPSARSVTSCLVEYVCGAFPDLVWTSPSPTHFFDEESAIVLHQLVLIRRRLSTAPGIFAIVGGDTNFADPADGAARGANRKHQSRGISTRGVVPRCIPRDGGDLTSPVHSQAIPRRPA